jgi:hypothetical protein
MELVINPRPSVFRRQVFDDVAQAADGGSQFGDRRVTISYGRLPVREELGVDGLKVTHQTGSVVSRSRPTGLCQFLGGSQFLQPSQDLEERCI